MVVVGGVPEGVLGAPPGVLVAAGGVLVAAGGVLVAAGGVLVAAGGVLVAAGGVLVVPTTGVVPDAHSPLDADAVALAGVLALVVPGAPEPDIEGSGLVVGLTVLAVVVPALTDGKQLPVAVPAGMLDGSVAVLVPVVPGAVAAPPGVGVLPTDGVVVVWGVLVIVPGVPGAVLVRGVAIVTGVVPAPWAGFAVPIPVFVPVPVCVPAAGVAGVAVPVAAVCATATPSANSTVTARIAARVLMLVSPALMGLSVF